MKAGHVKRIRRDTKRLFLKKGTCSRALFYILDREFGHPQDDEERAVELLAGGIGLSGGGCGALAAAVWMNALSRIRDKTYKTSLSDPVAERILRTFLEAAGSELDCRVITGRLFPTVADHTEFIEGGGCGRLIQDMAGAVSFR